MVSVQSYPSRIPRRVWEAPGMVSAQFEHFPHGADIGIRGIGASRPAAFAQAAAALDRARDRSAPRWTPRTAVAIEFVAPSDRPLLYDWLNR